jgi:hypothetical protein
LPCIYGISYREGCVLLWETLVVRIWFFDDPEWQIAKQLGVIPKPTKVDGDATTEEEQEEQEEEPEEAEEVAAPGHGKFNFVSEGAPHQAREPSGSELEPGVQIHCHHRPYDAGTRGLRPSGLISVLLCSDLHESALSSRRPDCYSDASR